MNPALTALARILTGLMLGLVTLAVAVVLFVRQPSLRDGPRLVFDSADAGRLRRHVSFLAGEAAPRDVQHPENLERAASYLEAELRGLGLGPRRQTYDVHGRTFTNVVVELGGGGSPLVVGAHYDAFGDTNANPGADDNASGTAGLLEVARLLTSTRPQRRVILAFYSTEEPPYYHSESMGSAVHAASLSEDGEGIEMICLEMIGYYSERQPWPSPLFALAYPTTGNFVSVIGRWSDRALARRVRDGIEAASHVPAFSYSGPSVSGVEASDHSSYWARGYSAVMVTDTAFIRNANYHAPSDTAESLDYGRMAEVVTGVANAVARLARR